MKEIKDYPGYYIDECGNVYSTRKNGGALREPTLMSVKTDKDGYYYLGLYRDGVRHFERVNRLVANTFIPNPDNLPQVNHKDGDVKNNNVSNLEWCTCSENLKHSFRELNRSYSGYHKSVKLTNKKTGETKVFYSIRKCADFLKMSHEYLGRLLNKKVDINKWSKKDTYEINYI